MPPPAPPPRASDTRSKAPSRRLAARLVVHVEPGAEQVGGLVVSVCYDRFLEGYDVRPELAQAVDEDRSSLVPRPVPPPKVERGDARHARADRLLHPPYHEPPGSLMFLRESDPSIAARIGDALGQLPRNPLRANFAERVSHALG